MKIRNLTISAVFTALICIIAPFTIPIGPIPISLATFMVYLCAGVLGAKRGTLAVIVYIALGAVGLPVFSGLEGGLQKIAGVTGGYIIGYIPCAFVIGLMTDKIKGKWVYPISMVIGTALCYAVGLIWFMYQTKMNLWSAILVCVLPFLVGDCIKIVCASILAVKIKKDIPIA